MDEFINRIAAQRIILQIVNRSCRHGEALLGLSRNAIERWVGRNGLDRESPSVSLIEAVSSRLFFLANKSQQQISEDYRLLATEVALLTRKIDEEFGSAGRGDRFQNI
jgi:hypothetical protein